MLNEYALRFYSFLEMSIKLDANEQMQTAMTHNLSMMSEDTRKRYLEGLESTAYDIIEDMKNNAQTGNMDDLKRALSG